MPSGFEDTVQLSSASRVFVEIVSAELLVSIGSTAAEMETPTRFP